MSAEEHCHIRGMRRAYDREDFEARRDAFKAYEQALIEDRSPFDSVMAALKSYRDSLAVMACRRMGVRG